MGLGDDVTVDRLANGLFHEVLVVVQHQRQDVSHLAIAAVTLHEHAAQALEARWQIGERRAITQHSGLALHHGKIMGASRRR